MSFIEQVKKIVGKESVSTSSLDKMVYSFDASQVFGKTIAVIWPKNSQQVAEIIKQANLQKIPIVPRGAGTGLLGGAVPENAYVIDLSKMDQIEKTGKDTCTVQAGVTIDELNIELEKKDSFFPVIPASHEVATVGGTISTNASGMRAIRYGPIRNWIKKLQVVTGKGTIIEVGDKQIDDFCGTEGTVGIITKAEIKTAPIIRRRSLSNFKFNTPIGIQAKIEDILKQKNVIALELVDSLTSKISGFGPENHILVEYDDMSGEIKDESEIEKVWEIREGAHSKMCAAGWIISDDIQVPVEKIEQFLSWALQNNIPCFGHVGIGALHPYYPVDRAEEKQEKLQKFLEELGGSPIGEHGVGLLKKRFVNPAMRERIKKLKEKYDPNNILNRGKII